jgi:hypothetical protein
MIRKPDPKTGMRQVHVYDPARRKRCTSGHARTCADLTERKNSNAKRKPSSQANPPPRKG